MLHHIVLMEPKDEQSLTQIRIAMEILTGVCAELPGASGFSHGPNRDFEGKSQRYAYGFSVFFTDREAHLAYEAHPDHLRAGSMLVAASKGGHAGIFVADLQV